MAPELQNDIRCAEFEALLTDALDGALNATTAERFHAHRQGCAACAAMFGEAEAGMGWLRGLEPVEPPAHLLHRILDATTGATSAPARESLLDQLRAFRGGMFAPFLQPRFAMTVAMAFFSGSILLNLAGVRLSDVRASDLRPSTLTNRTVQTYYETQARVVKYYENLRLVYEIESRVREIKSAPPAEEPPKEKDKTKRNQNEKTSERPDRRKDQNEYSSEFRGSTMAALNCGTAELPNCGIENNSAMPQGSNA